MKTGLAPIDWLLLVGALVLAFLLLGPVVTIPLHIPVNYNEGWDAYFAQRAVTPGTGPLYPPPGSLVFNNYPPLSFYLVGAFGLVVGDMIVAGRIISLLSLLASGVLLGVCVRRLGGSLRGAVAASLLLLLYASSVYREYVAVNDPQWLAHALMLGGLAVLLRSRDVTKLPSRDVILAALLMLAGGFVKHNLVAMPVAVTIWLAWLNRRAAMTWFIAAAIGLCAGLALIDAVDGHAAFADILQHRRLFLARRMTKAIGRLLPLVPMAIMAAAVLARSPRRHPALLLLVLFASIATVVGVVQRMGEGVYYNAHFETLIALCLSAGLALSPDFGTRLRLRGRMPGPAVLAGIAALPFIVTMPWNMAQAWHDLHDANAREASWRPVIERIAAAPGPAGCEMLSLCYWAGKPYQVDMFNFTQSVLVGGSIDRFRSMVDQRRFGIFQYTPRSFIHEDAIRQLGRDPVMDCFTGLYTAAASGPQGILLLVPIQAHAKLPRAPL